MGVCLRIKTAFDQTKIDKIFGHPFLTKDLLYHRQVTAGAIQRLAEAFVFILRQMIDGILYTVVENDWDRIKERITV